MGRFRLWFESIIHLPKVEQSHNYDCGAACLRAICQYFGVGPDDEDEFISVCRATPEDGTEPEALVRAAKHCGLQAHKIEGMTVEQLRAFLKASRPVICDIQAWGEQDDYHTNKNGHYIIALGFDDKNFYFEDPSIHDNDSRGHLPIAEFEKRWHDVDKNGQVFKRLGIVLWKNVLPEKKRAIVKTQKID